ALAVDVQAGVAQLPTDPGAGFGLPAGEAAQGGLGLVPAAATLAPVVGLAAVADEATVRQAAAAPAQARGQRGAGAVVIVAVAVALEIAAQVGPPAASFLSGQRRQLRAHAYAPVAPGHLQPTR